MRRVYLIGMATISTIFASCSGTQETQDPSGNSTTTIAASEHTPEHEIIRVKGKISRTENGKDGYTAVITDENGKEFIVTISMVNLQKTGSQFKKHEAGETITITGASWKDPDGKIYVTAESLQ